MTELVIWIVAVFFLGVGAFGLVAPAALIAPFRMIADSPESRAEIRAVYGGFGIAISACLVAAALDLGHARRGVVIAVAAALLGMAFGRLVSRAVDGRLRFYPIWFYFWVELVGGGLLGLVALAA